MKRRSWKIAGTSGENKGRGLLDWDWDGAGTMSSSSDGKIAELQDRCSLGQGLGSR